MIGHGRSLAVENNAGHDVFPATVFGNTAEGGVARVDFDELVAARLRIGASHLTAFDFRTGATLYRAHTGARLGYGNRWASVPTVPDGTAYLGSILGLLPVRDR